MISVIFVEPESAENIGSIARCIKNFGAHQLILVRPCALDGAWKMAMHAADILENARIVNTFSHALLGIDTVIATTSEASGLTREALTPRDIPVKGNIGIVIGRESTGLTNKEIAQCDIVVSIPTTVEYPVLNAASACCILLYELQTCTLQKQPASKECKQRILHECTTISDSIETRPFRKKIWLTVIKKVVSKSFLTERESTVLLGFFRRIRTVLEATPSQKD
ncbi:MAG: TrmJ/YjtD family RNA methyltransferase [Candidatus Methanofastidiosia archaeon]|jgi:TrmH family RNA methyltransferase